MDDQDAPGGAVAAELGAPATPAARAGTTAAAAAPPVAAAPPEADPLLGSFLAEVGGGLAGLSARHGALPPAFVPRSSGLLMKELRAKRPASAAPAPPAPDPGYAALEEGCIEITECEVTWLTSEAEVERILAGVHTAEPNFFDVLKVPSLASVELIKKHYKKLSVLIHPDKCSHEEATDAFHALTTAYNELLKPEYRSRYKTTLNEARELYKQQLKAENKERAKRGEAPLEFNEADPSMAQRLVELSEQILKDRKEKLEYAEKCRQSNEAYELLQSEMKAAEEYRKRIDLEKWKSKQGERIAGWRDFKSSAALKRARVGESVLDRVTKRAAKKR